MEEKTQGFVESVAYPYPIDDERSKVTMVFKKKNNSQGDANVRQKLDNDDSDEDGRHSGSEEHTKAKKEGLQRRLSTETIVKEKNAETSSSPKKASENNKVISYPTLVPFCLPKEPGDTDKYQDIIAASDSELKDIKLTQLSSERDRSISVERSSSSSREEIVSKKPPTDGAVKPRTETKGLDRKEKELSHPKESRKRESSEDKSQNPSKLPSPRSKSRSPSKHRRRDSPPRQRSRDRHRDRSPRSSHSRHSRSPRRYSRDRSRRSHSRGKRSRSRGHRSRSRDRHGSSHSYRHRSRSYERKRYRDRSSSRDRYRKRGRRTPSTSPSRSRGRSTHERSKGRLTGLDKVASLTLPNTAGPMTPQMALQQTMAAMSAKAQALTGIELPKYYNPAAVNPLKYAEQVQKRKLLWETKKEKTQEQQPKNTIWDKLTFQQDQDGKMTEKFRKLMGIKSGGAIEETKEVAPVQVPPESATLQNQEELFRNLDQQYEMARMSTHTHRGVGLGYSSQAIFPPLQKP